MKKLAIIGASYLQEPLIQKAKSMGIETHVFAWKANDVGEKSADYFYPISIVEKEQILEKCCEIGIDGICSIASDLAMVAVNYVASQMGLVGNSMDAMEKSTNKHLMRMAFEAHGDPSPKSILTDDPNSVDLDSLKFPVIVKPTDRSGSRGITKLESAEGLHDAICRAVEQSFEKKALVEEFAVGQEYSVEYISFCGQHHFLALTHKFTTGAPHFIETGHLQPAPVSIATENNIRRVVEHALDSLGVENGASHTEVKVDGNGQVRLIEIGARMGGDFIGSDLVEMSTGVDFVRAVIDIALGNTPDLSPRYKGRTAAVRFIFSEDDLNVLEALKKEHPAYLKRAEVHQITGTVTDSSTRFGFFLLEADDAEQLLPYLPKE